MNLDEAPALAGINDLERANRFLEDGYLREFNQRFERPAASPVDAHGGVPRHLDEVLSWEEQRVVQRDWTVACAGQWYQIDRQHEGLSLARRTVVVRTLRDGRVQLVYGGRKLKWRPLPCRPAPRRQIRSVKALSVRRPPAPSHPWRRPLLRAGRAARFGLGDSGRPPLRSGLPPSPSPKRGKDTTNNNQQKGTFSPKF